MAGVWKEGASPTSVERGPGAIGAPSAGLSLGRVARPQSPPPFHPAGGA